MNDNQKVAVYVAMLIWDLAIIFGFGWFISHGHSGWWALLGILILAGSDPKNIINGGKPK